MALIPKEWISILKNKSNNVSSSSSSSSNNLQNSVSDVIVTSDHGCQKILFIEASRGTIRSMVGSKNGTRPSEELNPKGVAVFKYRNEETNLEKLILIVVDSNNNRVQSFDIETGEFMNQFTNRKLMKQPFGVAVNQQNGQIIVANIDTNSVTVHAGYTNKTNNNNSNHTFGTLLKVIGVNDDIKFDHPRGVAINSRGDIIVSSNHKIDILDGSDFKLVKSFGSQGKETGQFSQPLGVCVDRRDNILVSDYDNHRIQIFDREGNWIHMFGKRGSSSGNSGCFFYLYDVVVDSDDNIFVADSGNRRICIF